MKTTKPDLSLLKNEEILKLRFCDLGISVKGTWLEECVAELYRELDAKGIAFKPQCYLADEWLTPDNEPVVGIPFYLAHPRLKELEQSIMHEVEGGDKKECMKLLRHETGHAVNYAYRCYTQKQSKKLFGHFYDEYPDRYKYRPYSRSFVIHLDDWYAQYHPDEDFAETFAVWLSPDSNWQEKYKGWRALEKLEYVDLLMKREAVKPPRKSTGQKYWHISTLKTTLATHYKRKTEFYAEHSPDFHDAHLIRIFRHNNQTSKPNAYKVLSKYKKDILSQVSYCTGERKYIVNQVLKNLIARCKQLALVSAEDDTHAVMKTTAYITALIMNYVYSGRFKRKK
ncbi:MAG: hypothetical protein A2293_03785 [Elusimicrobia bacterium RIFOXYB2_FULL_49_7]|nr:MAG: hypothetical protein A2293_03785 [Elusimicrobia bacterium RIFOXYB2_FULL_49_7]